ncbi:hypothetical protein FRC11_010427, partial [Ceratobasidium sp. 423]
MERDALSVDVELQGLRALHEISQLATEGQTTAQLDPELVMPRYSLDAALGLALDPKKIRHLGNPSAISGCIRLMRSIRDQKGNESIYDRGYGYLCFQLLVVALNICLMERWDRLDEVLATSDTFSDIETYTVVWNAMSSEIINQFHFQKSGGDCDRILGWSTSIPRWKTPLLLGSEVLTLLELLWNSRKQFLLALIKDESTACGLSGLFFLLWRYVARERSFNNPKWKILYLNVLELALRYDLVARGEQRSAMLPIIDASMSGGEGGGWTGTAKHVDVEDSQLIMAVFIRLISNSPEPDFLATRHPLLILRLVSLSVDVDSQGLLPDVIKCTLEYAWSALNYLEKAEEHVGA